MNTEALLTGIRDANYHEGGIRCLQIFRVEEAYFSELQREVKRLCQDQTGSKANESGHITHWAGPRGEVVQYSLLNRSSRYDDFHSDHDLSSFGKRFHGAAKYPGLARLASLFPEATNFRVNSMGPQARLSPHEEHSVIRTQAGSVALRIRLHLPVFTNPAAELMLDGEIYHLEAGIMYFVNHGCVHSACNGGNDIRVHLVWDVLLTRNAYSFLFKDEPPDGMLKRFAETEQVPRCLRTEKVGAYARIAPQVTREQADWIVWCDVQ